MIKASLLGAQFGVGEGVSIPAWHVKAHNEACGDPRGIELGLIGLVAALERYADEYHKSVGIKVGDDGYADTLFLDIVRGINGLLSCETGRLDCGKISYYLTDLALRNGITDKELDCGIER